MRKKIKDVNGKSKYQRLKKVGFVPNKGCFVIREEGKNF